MSKEHILQTAYKMAVRYGFNTLTRDNVAAEAGVAMGSVNHHYGTMEALRDAVVEKAIEEKNANIIVCAMAMNNGVIAITPKAVIKEALGKLI